MAKNDLWWVLHFSCSNIFERSLCLNHLVYVYCSLFLPLWIKFSHSNHCLQHSVMIWPYFKLHSFKGFSLSRKSHWIINNIHILRLWLIYYFFSYICNFCSHFLLRLILLVNVSMILILTIIFEDHEYDSFLILNLSEQLAMYDIFYISSLTFTHYGFPLPIV